MALLEYDADKIAALGEAEALAALEEARELVAQAQVLRSLLWKRITELRHAKHTDAERLKNRVGASRRKIRELEADLKRADPAGIKKLTRLSLALEVEKLAELGAGVALSEGRRS